MKRLRVLVCVHDWGGINLIAPLLRTWNGSTSVDCAVIAMPTVRRELADLAPGMVVAPGSEALTTAMLDRPAELRALLKAVVGHGYDAVVCGTSLHSQLERRLTSVAREMGVATIAYCDMAWAIDRRLREGDEWMLPDRLWVPDEETKAAAAEIAWPGPLPVDVVGNTMIDDLIRRRAGAPAGQGAQIRFVSEPASTEFPEARVDEFACAEMLLTAVRGVGDAPVVIRTHPAEPQEAWRRWTYARRDRGVALDTLPLDAAIANTSLAIGLCSSLLIQMRLCGVPAASLQLPPADAGYFCLPFDQFGVSRVASASQLAQWLRAPGAGSSPAGGAVHVGAVQRATRLISAFGAAG